MENPAPTYRIYRLKWWWRAFALFFLAIGAFSVIVTWGMPIAGQAEAKPIQMMISVVFLIVGTGLTINFFKTSIIFTTDAIELHMIFTQKRLPLNAIRGRREYAVSGDEAGNTRYLKLVPNDDRLPTLDFMKGYTFDDAFCRWFYELPDLDAEDNKVHKDANFGLV
jgi:hypothetical protein